MDWISALIKEATGSNGGDSALERDPSPQWKGIANYVTEMRPRLHVRWSDAEPRKPVSTYKDLINSMPTTTTSSRLPTRQSLAPSIVEPTNMPSLHDMIARSDPAGSLLLDTTVLPPSLGQTMTSIIETGPTVPASELPNGATGTGQQSSVMATQTSAPTASAAPVAKGGSNSTTEIIAIAVSVGGAVIIIVGLLLWVSKCYRRRKRREGYGEQPARHIAQQLRSTASINSDGLTAGSFEMEKQSLMRLQNVSPLPSPGARSLLSPSPQPQRPMGYPKSALPRIPESPQLYIAEQPMSPTSVYSGTHTRRSTLVELPESPTRPPPLLLSERRASDPEPVTAPLTTPKSPFYKVRLPFASGTPATLGKRRSSWGRSVAASSVYSDEETGLGGRRQTIESDTLPKSSGYRDSLWSVAASSYWASRQSTTSRLKSGYSDWNAVASSAALSHTQSVQSRLQRADSQTRGAFDMRYPSDSTAVPPSASGQHQRHSSEPFSPTRLHDTLIPQVPPMPSIRELQQIYGNRPARADSTRNATGKGPDPQLKGRLHSLDFWAQEQQDMRSGAFQPAELEGSPPPVFVTSPKLDLDERMELAASSGGSTRPTSAGHSGLGVGERSFDDVTPLTAGLGGNSSGHLSIPPGYLRESQVMAGSSAEHSRSSSTNRGPNFTRASSSTVATVFRQHPGDAVMF